MNNIEVYGVKEKSRFIFPEIPNSWIIFIISIALIVIRAFGIDTWTTAAISTLIGYMTGKHIERNSRH